MSAKHSGVGAGARARETLPAAHLFESNVIQIGVRTGDYLPAYAYAFIEMFAPHLDRGTVVAAVNERMRNSNGAFAVDPPPGTTMPPPNRSPCRIRNR